MPSSLPFPLPEGLSEAEFRSLVPADMWERDPQQAASVALRRSIQNCYSRCSAKKIKVSVIMPAYNSAAYIRKSINSLITQTLYDIEIIIIDDGSSDNTINIIKEYEHIDDRIVFRRQNHKGAGCARNLGLSFAQGEYIAFLDADDFFAEDALEIAYEAAKSTNADIAIYKTLLFDNKTNEVTKADYAFLSSNIPPQTVFSAKDMPDTIFNSFKSWPWNKIFKKQFIKDNNIFFQNLKKTNDLYFVFRALVQAKRIIAIHSYLVYYRVNNSASTQSTNDEAPIDFWSAVQFFKNFLKKNNIYFTYEKSIINAVLSGALYNLKSLKTKKGFIFCYQTIKNEILREFDITKYSSSYFYSSNVYNTMMSISTMQCLDYIQKNKITFQK